MYLNYVVPLLLSLLIASCNDNSQTHIAGYVEGENIFLASPFSGVLEKLLVHRGQHVSKGSLLFILDPKPQIMTLVQVRGELQQAQASLADLKKPRRLPELSAIEAQINKQQHKLNWLKSGSLDSRPFIIERLVIEIL